MGADLCASTPEPAAWRPACQGPLSKSTSACCPCECADELLVLPKAQWSVLKQCASSLLRRFVSLVVVCYLDRTSLAFAALQLCNEDWFNAQVYGLVSST